MQPRNPFDPAEQEPHYERNGAWEDERSIESARAVRFSQYLAGGCVLALVLALSYALAEKATRVEPPPIVIVVDQITGEVRTQRQLKGDPVPEVEAMDMSYAAKLVRARYSYHWQFLQRDSDTVACMSTEEVFKPYDEWAITGKKSLQEKVQGTQDYDVRIVSVRPQDDAAGRWKEAVITYDLVSRYLNRSQQDTIWRHTAVVQFKYDSAMKLSDACRLENPFSFVALGVRTTPDVRGPQPLEQPAAKEAQP